MQLDTQHWHVGVTYPGYQDGYEDPSFADVDSALDYADQTRDGFREDGHDGFREDGHKVTEVDRRDDDKAGVIERYRAADGEGATAPSSWSGSVIRRVSARAVVLPSGRSRRQWRPLVETKELTAGRPQRAEPAKVGRASALGYAPTKGLG